MSNSVRNPHLCDVYLCCAIMQQPGSRFLSVFASTSRSVSGNYWEKHWLVVFDYGGDEVFVCDADMDHAGHLTGRSAWKRRAMFEDLYPHKKHLGKHEVSKARIELVMRKMSDSGSYHLTKNNCQKWALSFLQELGIDVAMCDPQAEQVVEEVIKPAAVGGAAAVGALAIGALLTAGIRKNKK